MPRRNVLAPLKHIQTLIALEEYRSISAAAVALGTTQSALTKALRRAEDDLGQQLFERKARGVVPTVAGKAVLAHARIIQSHSIETLNAIDALRNFPGTLQVGAGASFLDALLPQAIAKVVSHYPTVEIGLKVNDPASLLNQLREAKLDLLFVSAMPGIESENDVDWLPMINDEMDVVARSGHPLAKLENVSLKDLHGYGWVLGGANDPQQRYLQNTFMAEGVVFPGATVESHSRTVAIRVVEQSDLLTLVPNLRTIPEHKNLTRINCPSLRWTRVAGIVVRKGHTLPPAGKTLVSQIRKACLNYN